MQVNKTTKLEVFQRFMAKIRKGIPPSFQNRVYLISGQHTLPENIRDNEFIIVRVSGGSWDFAGGVRGSGTPVAPYESTAIVELRKINRQDRSGTDEIALLDDAEGVLAIQQDILRSVSGSYLELETDPYSTAILTEPILPLTDSDADRSIDELTGAEATGAESRIVFSISFSLRFHWSLS